MAKRGVFDHEKTIELAECLGIPECYALGVLEAFWHWVARHRQDGSLAECKPLHIARAIRFPGDPLTLWNALVASGWIDVTEAGCIVHDWSEHADNSVHKALRTKGLMFADGHAPFTRNTSKHKPSKNDSTQNQQDTGAIVDVDDGNASGITNNACQKPEASYQIPVAVQTLTSSASDDDTPQLALIDQPAASTGSKRRTRKDFQLSEWHKPRFEQFWGKYWRKVCRIEAEKSFQDKVKTEELFSRTMQSLESQIPAMMARDPENRPHASTWLNQARFNDEVPPPKTLSLVPGLINTNPNNKLAMLQQIVYGKRAS